MANNIFSQIFGNSRKDNPLRQPDVITNGFSFNTSVKTNAGVIIRPEEALKDATVLACVHTIASTVAQLPMNIVDANGDIIMAGKLPALIQKPNDFQTRYALQYSMVNSLLTHGNIFLRVIRTKTNKNPVSIVPIDPSDMTVSSNVSGRPIYEHATFGIIPTEEIIHVMDVCGFESTGQSRVVLAAERIAALISSDRLMGDTFNNGVAVNHIFTVDPSTSDDKVQALQTAIKDRFASGGTNRGGAMMLDGATMQAVKGSVPGDADLRELRQHLIQEIAAVFRIPSSMVGGGESAKYSNLRQSQTSYYRDTIAPIVDSIEQSFDLKIATGGMSVKFDVSSLLKGDSESQVRMYQQGVAGGFITPNEAREGMGLKPIEGGDELASAPKETHPNDMTGSEDQPNPMNPEATNRGDSNEKE